MKLPSILTFLLLCSCFAASVSGQTYFEKELAGLMPTFNSENIQERNAAMDKWHQRCIKAQSGIRKDICRSIAKYLKDTTPVHTRIYLIRQLEHIGKEESAYNLRELMLDKNARVREAARRALTNNPTDEAAFQLNRFLKTNRSNTKVVPETFMVSVINSIGFRKNHESIPALQLVLNHKSQSIRVAAFNALSKIKHPDAEKLIVAAFEKNPQNEPAASAYLKIANRILQSGDRTRAAVRFEKLVQAKLKTNIRLAIIRGHLESAGKLEYTPQTLTEKYLRQTEDPLVQQVAARFIPRLSNESTQELAERCSNFPKSAQLAFLRVIGSTRKASALEPVLKMCRAKDEEIQVAAINALAGLANEKTVPFLVETMMAGGKRGEAAAKSLERVFATGVDQRIAKLMVKESDAQRLQRFLRILDRRRATSEIDSIVQQCLHENQAVRQQAFQIASRLGSPSEIPKLVEIHAKNANRGERDTLEKTIVTICRRIPNRDEQEKPIVSIYSGARRDSQIKLLPMMGRLGGKEALKLVRRAAQQDDEKLVDAAVTALANWPNAEVTDDLLRVSTHSNRNLRIRSVRALARVVVLRDNRNDQQRLAMLRKTMSKAERDQERDLILDRAKAIRTVETLRFVLPYLDNAKLRERACRTVVELAHHRGLRQPNQAEFDKALTRVTKLTTDKRLAERAKNYMKK